MAGTMFEELVSSRARAGRNWYTVPLSFVIHTALVIVLIIVPLLATDMLPTPRTVLQYAGPAVMPIVEPPQPIRPARQVPGAAGTASTPVIAPDTIEPETGIVAVQQDQRAIETASIDGIVGLGVAGAGSEVLPPPAVASERAPVRLSAGIKAPVRTRYVPPVYPQIARDSRVEGTVIIEAVISATGSIGELRVLRSHPLLDDAALAAVRQWEYTPTLLNGRPTPVIMVVTVRFALR